MYSARTIQNYIEKVKNQFPIFLITGPRQVGKTTFLRHISEPNRTYVTLDDPLVRDLAKTDPNLFMQRFPPPLLIDEIQYAPELLPYIKMYVDTHKKTNLFWMTGSQQFHLMKGVAESLAGRVALVRLLGFSQRERFGVGLNWPPFLTTEKALEPRLNNSSLGLAELYKAIWQGCFPAIVLNEDMDRNLFYSSYVQTYVQRDIRDLAQVGNELSFIKFLRAVAARTAQILNLTDLARDVDIAPNTAKHWLSLLSASGIVYLMEPYYSNLTKRIIKSPKIYMLDTGLCSWLTQWSSWETLESGAMSGAILETWVISEVLKSWWHNGLDAPIFYYRDKEQHEIDLLFEQDGTLYPVEIKKSGSPNLQNTKNFSVLNKLKMPVGPGAVVCLVSQSLPLSKDIISIPVGNI